MLLRPRGRGWVGARQAMGAHLRGGGQGGWSQEGLWGGCARLAPGEQSAWRLLIAGYLLLFRQKKQSNANAWSCPSLAHRTAAQKRWKE